MLYDDESIALIEEIILATDPSYKSIKNASDLSVGQRIWIPPVTPKPAPSNTTTITSTKKEPDANLLTLPKTNCEIRIWYNYQVVAISKLNEKWKADGMSLEARAEKAYETRHNARINARYMMQNKDEVKATKIIIDGCQITNGIRCDYMYLIKDSEIYIELKGQDIKHAIEQIETTIKKLSSNLKKQKKKSFIICTRSPLTSTSIQNIQVKFRKNYNSEFIVKSSPHKHIE